MRLGTISVGPRPAGRIARSGSARPARSIRMGAAPRSTTSASWQKSPSSPTPVPVPEPWPAVHPASRASCSTSVSAARLRLK